MTWVVLYCIVFVVYAARMMITLGGSKSEKVGAMRRKFATFMILFLGCFVGIICTAVLMLIGYIRGYDYLGIWMVCVCCNLLRFSSIRVCFEIRLLIWECV